MVKRFAVAVVAALLILFGGNSRAGDDGLPVDLWTGPDKPKHFVVSAFCGVVATGLTRTDGRAFALAMAPGVVKEILDARTPGNRFSAKDLAWDALGAALGVAAGGVFIRYAEGHPQVVYVARW